MFWYGILCKLFTVWRGAFGVQLAPVRAVFLFYGNGRARPVGAFPFKMNIIMNEYIMNISVSVAPQ